jgi:hypothetical protein
MHERSRIDGGVMWMKWQLLTMVILMSISVLGNPTRCVNITINNTMPIAMQDFPIPINITYDADAQTDFDDYRLNSTACQTWTGTTLPCELEYKSNSGNVEIWCRVNLSVGQNIFGLSYGDAALTTAWNDSQVWVNYTLVIHMNGSISDSTRQYSEFTVNVAAPDAKKLAWGTSYYYNGVNSYINLTSNDTGTPSIKLGYHPRTTEIWWFSTVFPSASGDASGHRMFNFVNITGAYFPWTMRIRETTNILRYDVQNASGASPTSLAGPVPTGNLTSYSAGASYLNTSLIHQYQNAYVAYGTLANINNQTGKGLYIGSMSTTGGEWRGYLDEVRISNMGRSQWWLNYTYVTVSSNGKYVTFGAESTIGGAAATSCTCPIAGDWRWNFLDACTITVPCDISGWGGRIYTGDTQCGTWTINTQITAVAGSWLYSNVTWGCQKLTTTTGGYIKIV